jgi:hypothetical protein
MAALAHQIRPLAAGSGTGCAYPPRNAETGVCRETGASVSATKLSRFGASDLDQSVCGTALNGTRSRARGENARHLHSERF